MFIVEGNIGAGKSTFLSLLKASDTDLTIIQEPVHNWASKRYGQSLLEEFYKQPGRWAFTIETFAMLARSLDHVRYQNPTNNPVIMERSIYSGHYCFAQNGLEAGYFNPIEWEVYLKWVDFILYQQCNPPAGFIYLKASPETCLNRINKRNRNGEDLVTLSYLEKIHERHEKFLITKELLDKTLHHIPVLVLDVSEEFQSNKEIFKDFKDKISTFVKASRKIAYCP